jgi:hypothetical protein
MAAPVCHLTEWKLLIMKDVTGCCYFVAGLLLVKRLIINDVTDVAGFKSIISISERVNQWISECGQLGIGRIRGNQSESNWINWIKLNPTKSKTGGNGNYGKNGTECLAWFAIGTRAADAKWAKSDEIRLNQPGNYELWIKNAESGSSASPIPKWAWKVRIPHPSKSD